MSLQSTDTELASLSLPYSLHILNFFIPDYLRLQSKDFSLIQTHKDIYILYNKINSLLTTAFSNERIIEEDISLLNAIDFFSNLLREERHAILNVVSPIIYINNDTDDEASMSYLILLLCFYFSLKDYNTLFRGLTAMNQHDQYEYLILLNRYIYLEMSTPGIVITLLLSLHNKISTLEKRLNSNKGNNDSRSCFSHNAYESMTKSTLTNPTVNTMSQFNSPIANKQLREDNSKVLIDSPIKLDFTNLLTEQDYLNIIVKKDYDLSQLQLKLEAYIREVNDNKRLISNKNNEIESIRRELEASKAQYETEFELMASAMYNIGSVLMQNKGRNTMLINNDCGLSSNWLKQKQRKLSRGDY